MGRRKPFINIPEYFTFDFEADRYEMAGTELLKKLHLSPKGSIYEIETNGTIMYESFVEYCALSSKVALYTPVGEKSKAASILMYFLSKDGTKYIPVDVHIMFIFDDYAHILESAIGSMRIVRDIPAKDVRRIA